VLSGTYNQLSSTFPHFHYEVFAAPDDKLNDLAQTKVQFVTNMDGDIGSVLIALESSIKPIEFIRQPDAAFKNREFLKQFAGLYEIGSVNATVALRDDNVLTLAIPGQSVRELAGLRGKKFIVKGLNGFSIEFIKDKSGSVTQAAFYQPSGNFVAVRIG
jgi:hypothetical protein